MNWEIVYYSEKVKAAIFALPPDLRADLSRLYGLLQTHGADLRLPHSRAMGGDCSSCGPTVGKVSDGFFIAHKLGDASSYFIASSRKPRKHPITNWKLRKNA